MPRRSARLANKRSRKSFEKCEIDEEYEPQSSDSEAFELSEDIDDTDTLTEEVDELDKYKYSQDEADQSGENKTDNDGISEPPQKRRKLNAAIPRTQKINRGGFSTKAKALQTIQFIKGRDVRYQVNMISSFLCGARSILKKAKTEEKKKNINEAIDILKEWMDEYENNKDYIENFDHLSLDIIKEYEVLVDFYNMEERKNKEMEYEAVNVFDIDKVYLDVFDELNGEIRALRVTQKRNMDEDGDTEFDDNDDGISWDIVRNNKLLELKEELIKYDIRCDGRIKTVDDALLYYKRGKLKGMPSRLHLQMIMYGYSPHKSLINKLSKNVAKIVKEVKDGNKR